MTNHTDFDEIGKKTPYRIPEGFFDEMQQQVLQQVEEPRKSWFSARRISYAVIGMAAAVCAFVFIPRPTDVAEQQSASISWIEQMSDDDLQALYDLSDNDIFMD